MRPGILERLTRPSTESTLISTSGSVDPTLIWLAEDRETAALCAAAVAPEIALLTMEAVLNQVLAGRAFGSYRKWYIPICKIGVCDEDGKGSLRTTGRRDCQRPAYISHRESQSWITPFSCCGFGSVYFIRRDL